MAAIVDVFVALTNPRAYAEAIAPYDALRKLSEWSATLFHPPLVEQFVQAIGVFHDQNGSTWFTVAASETTMIATPSQTPALVLMSCEP